jgi:hypothetical protein
MSDQMVLTPGGYRPQSFVNAIAPGHALTVIDAGELAAIELTTNKMSRFVKPPALGAQFAAHRPGRRTQRKFIATSWPAPQWLANLRVVGQLQPIDYLLFD